MDTPQQHPIYDELVSLIAEQVIADFEAYLAVEVRIFDAEQALAPRRRGVHVDRWTREMNGGNRHSVGYC